VALNAINAVVEDKTANSNLFIGAIVMFRWLRFLDPFV